jgi:hypothetical protein
MLLSTRRNALASSPPSNLTENYYSCTQGNLAALFVAVGVSNGNVSALVVLITVMMVPISYLVLHFSDSLPVKEEYSDEERELALKELLNQILRARDGNAAPCVMKGYISRIAEELVEAASGRSRILRAHSVEDNRKSSIELSRKPKPRLLKQKSFAVRLGAMVDTVGFESSDSNRMFCADGNLQLLRSRTDQMAIIWRKAKRIPCWKRTTKAEQKLPTTVRNWEAAETLK